MFQSDVINNKFLGECYYTHETQTQDPDESEK